MLARGSVSDYPISAIERARIHRAAGWSLRRIAEFVEEEVGRRPAVGTVQRWTDEEAARAHQARGLARHRRHSAAGAGGGGRLGNPRATPEFKLARMAAMRERDLSLRSIAEMMALDFGDELSEHQVRYAFLTGRYPPRV